MVLSGLLAGIHLRELQMASHSANGTRAAQLATETLLSTLKDSETGQRGYLLTGDLMYLDTYEAAVRRFDADFAHLKAMPAFGHDWADRVEAIRRLAAAKLDELGQTVVLRQSGQAEAALAVVRTNRGRRVMDAIRVEVDALRSDEEARRTQMQLRTLSPARWIEVISLSALACVLLGWVALFHHHAHLRVAAHLLQLKISEREREQANDLLRTIVETAPGRIYAKDRDGRMLLANPSSIDLIGKPWPDIKGRTYLEFLDNSIQAEAVTLTDHRLMEMGRPEAIEESLGEHGGEERVWLSTKAPLRDRKGYVIGLVGVSVEITDRKRMELRLRVMLNELNHRVKNTLATVQAIAAQTLCGVDHEVYLAYEGRLIALASAHDVLTRENWAGADFHDVVVGQLGAYAGSVGDRFQLSGPKLRLNSRAALALAMGLHELATNAMKYGALSNSLGQVSIRWSLAADDASMLRLTWKERYGPKVSSSRRGFGIHLIERVLASDLGGKVHLRLDDSEGVICHIEAPLIAVVASASSLMFPQVNAA
jgi:PAS domain S-box-containing protein